ncbi:pyruvate dehydrogenase (acetyl-transferring) subunit E1 alpha [Sugiyamaella lignohabitans]|uniref:2-oxoisovalerate dehydrogenase subunit alpha n=1 Tax=Sugiyamaella lignohabitans TaxID=796027 RepID=A0A161HMV3_9ASCO|nr:pyruvate dehydrogenase (acetyl-transferring) subunit E1 alpha [Sugiyamaella lignohabitans]ANB15287.1 pyruvate dehydrogenase (acetyl-transferring) subunit E1 alpha [Sugiyamaella lignohabitans]
MICFGRSGIKMIRSRGIRALTVRPVKVNQSVSRIHTGKVSLASDRRSNSTSTTHSGVGVAGTVGGTGTVSQSSRGIQKELVFPGSIRSQFTTQLNFNDPSEATPMPTYRLIDLDGHQLDPEYKIPFDKEKSLKMYRDMLTVSIMDSIMYDAQRQGRLSFYMVSAGEEGAAVGSAAALEPHDVMFCQYREQGAILYRGVTLKEFMSQLYANADDYGQGRNMPVHYQSEKFNIHPISSPLATQIPHAAGAAYALKIRNKDNNEPDSGCVICYFGEGAASEGDFHAALNIAATRACPVIFFCRNNGYAISTPSLEQYKGDGIASRGVGYGIDTIRVDGNDLAAVHRVTREARKLAVENQRPVLIEAMSYRVSHHSTSDDSFAYRSKTEVEDWKRRDNPLARMRKWLELKDWWSEDLEQQTRKEIRREILSEMAAAEKRKKPSLDQIFNGVYSELTEPLKRQREELKEILDTYPEHYDLSHYEKGREGLN